MRILKIQSLKSKNKSWRDTEIIMLHACFQIFKDFVDNESKIVDWSDEVWNEMKALYEWWTARCQNPDFDNDAEDQEMLTRLINIRLYLWS